MSLRRIAAKLSGRLQRQRFPTPRDEFMRWMQFIHPGWLAPSNLALFAHCFDRLPSNAPIVEIGSFAGLSLNHIVYLLRKAGRSNTVFSADRWGFEGADVAKTLPGSSVGFADYREHVLETFRRNLLLFSGANLPHHIVADSDEFFRQWAGHAQMDDFFGRPTTLGGPISFAYIDGDHTREQSMRDFENVNLWLEPGGFVVFDDSADWGKFGSTETARQAAARPDYRLIGKNPNYCIQKV